MTTIHKKRLIKGAIFLSLMLLCFLLGRGCAKAEVIYYSDQDFADAVYRAENSKTHPYGIMAKYKHTTPRQACLNTYATNYWKWVKAGKPGDFIDFIHKVYAPIGAANDPKNLNRHWAKNVKFYLAKYARLTKGGN